MRDSPDKKGKPRCFVIRGLPGSGKSTLAKQYPHLLHLEEDMFAMRGGVYHWDSNTPQGIEVGRNAYTNFLEIVDKVSERKIDFVISSVFPFCRPYSDNKNNGFDDYLLGRVAPCIFAQLADMEYEVWIKTLRGKHKGLHNCPTSIYNKCFLSAKKFKESVISALEKDSCVYHSDFATRCWHWEEEMPSEWVAISEISKGN